MPDATSLNSNTTKIMSENLTEHVNAAHNSAHNADKLADATSPDALSFRGSVAGLKGLLSSKIAEGLASVVSTIDKVKENNAKREGGTEPIAIEKIYPCPDQPRQVFEPKSLEDLSQTMKEIGQAQAITVRKTAQGYEIISGERRYRAAKLAGFKELDCVVKNCTAQEGRLLALVENVQRQDLLPLEEALYLKKVLEENPDLSLEKLAQKLGSHKSTLSEKIQLTEVPEEFHAVLLAKGRAFTHRHWRVLSRIKDREFLRSMLMKALEHGLSVAELERSLAAAGVSKAPRRSARSAQLTQVDDQTKFSFVREDQDQVDDFGSCAFERHRSHSSAG